MKYAPVSEHILAKVIIYTTRFCPYCVRAKQILDSKSVDYNEIPVDGNPELRSEMTAKANGQYTVPQIWIDEYHVGGCTDLMALERSGSLNEMLVVDEA